MFLHVGTVPPSCWLVMQPTPALSTSGPLVAFLPRFLMGCLCSLVTLIYTLCSSSWKLSLQTIWNTRNLSRNSQRSSALHFVWTLSLRTWKYRWLHSQLNHQIPSKKSVWSRCLKILMPPSLIFCDAALLLMVDSVQLWPIFSNILSLMATSGTVTMQS